MGAGIGSWLTQLQSCLAPKFYQQAASEPYQILFHERQQQKIMESVMTEKKMREKLSDPSRISLDEEEHMAASIQKQNKLCSLLDLCCLLGKKKKKDVQFRSRTRLEVAERQVETTRLHLPG